MKGDSIANLGNPLGTSKIPHKCSHMIGMNNQHVHLVNMVFSSLKFLPSQFIFRLLECFCTPKDEALGMDGLDVVCPHGGR